jgi:uncharacterized protein YoxC
LKIYLIAWLENINNVSSFSLHRFGRELLGRNPTDLPISHLFIFSKTLVYETALRQNRVDDVITDISQSLDNCSSKLSVLINNPSDDMKQIEMSIAKLRILLNDIELVSYDIEQLKQTSSEDKNSVLSINNQWEELLKQATDKYNYFEKKLELMKLKQKTIDQIYHELDFIDKQVNESTINTKFPLLVERLEQIEEEINKQLIDDNQQIEELKSKKTKIFI